MTDPFSIFSKITLRDEEEEPHPILRPITGYDLFSAARFRTAAEDRHQAHAEKGQRQYWLRRLAHAMQLRLAALQPAPEQHRYVPGGFGCCDVCGLDADDTGPWCPHDPAHKCAVCPPRHHPDA